MSTPTFAMSAGPHPRLNDDLAGRALLERIIEERFGSRIEGHGLLSKPQKVLVGGRPFVYAMYDAEGRLCYLGSTMDLATRFRDHRKSSTVKGHHRWLAIGTSDLPTARSIESELLGVHLPYLNKRRAS